MLGKLKVKIIGILLSSFVFFYCEKNFNSVETNNWKGSIWVDVRTMMGTCMWHYSDGSKDYPRKPILVDLKILEESNQEFTTIQSKMTNSEGYVLFDSLEQGKYFLYPELTEDIGKSYQGESEIDYYNQNDTVEAWVGYKWGFNSYEFEINSIATLYAKMHGDTLKFPFYNIGIDTLVCEYDLSQVPNWLNLSFDKNICLPFGTEYDTTSVEWDKYEFDLHLVEPIYMILNFNYEDIPKNEIHSSFQVPVTHQYKTEIFTFMVNFPE